MNDRDAMDRLLRSWFAEDAVRTDAARFAGRVADATRGRRQQPGWLAWLTGLGIRVGRGSRGRTGGLLLAVTLVAGTVLAVVAGASFSVGGSPAPVPKARIFTSLTPWSFDEPAAICGEGTAPILPARTLPRVGPPAIEHPHNGMIAAGSNALIDPTSGAVTTRRLPGVSGLYGGDRWSPDGRWLATGLSDSGDHPTCRDVYLQSSDGTRLVDITGYARGDLVLQVAWSPDATWLAISRWMAPGGVAIDALGIGPEGSVVDARRLWTSDADGIESLAWSTDGTLAWTYSPSDGRPAMGLLVLRPGQMDPDAIDLGGVSLWQPRWSTAGLELVAVGLDASGNFLPGIYVITPSTGTVRAVPLAVRPLGGKYAWDTELFTSTTGRVFYPGRTAATGTTDIYSTALDGTDIEQLTEFPGNTKGDNTFGAVLSPDERQVAFGRYFEGSSWVVDVDGLAPARRLPGASGVTGLISWQPIR